MKTKLYKSLATASFAMLAFLGFGQTTAMDFSGQDCDANNVNATHPGLVKAYAFPYQNSTTCTYSSSWVVNNNLPLFAPMDSGAVQVAYYGGFGMPTVVLLGGDNHDVLFVTQDFNTSDTTTMRDLILNTFTAGVEEQTVITDLSVYPNPTTDFINVSFHSNSGSEGYIELTDLTGQR